MDRPAARPACPPARRGDGPDGPEPGPGAAPRPPGSGGTEPRAGDAAVVRTVTLGCDRDRAWWLVATAEGWGRWLGSEVRLDPSAGGALGLRDDDGALRVGRVVEAEEGRSLTFEWAPVGDASERSAVTLTVEDDDGGGTRVTVVERPAGGSVAACLDAGAAWDGRLVDLELDGLVRSPLLATVGPAL